MKQYILSGVTKGDSSVVLGAYSSFNEMQRALNKYHSTSTHLRYYFYDVVKLDADAMWTNQQMIISPK